jgi:hypothetical protein
MDDGTDDGTDQGDDASRRPRYIGVAVTLLYKISFPVKHLMPYYAESGCSRPLSPDFLNFSISP